MNLESNLLAHNTLELMDYITIFYYGVIFLSVIFLYFQFRATWNSVKELKIQRKEIHEAKRREFAIKLLNNWHSHNTLSEMFIAKKLVKELPKDTKKKIMEHKPIEISGDLISFIELTICAKTKKCINDCKNCRIYEKRAYSTEDDKKLTKIFLPEKSVLLLRSIIVMYFNNLEFIASAYKHNIADREIIKEQLSYIADDDENFLSLLNDFEIKKKLPCLTFFVEHIQKKQGKGKNILGKKTKKKKFFRNFLLKK